MSVLLSFRPFIRSNRIHNRILYKYLSELVILTAAFYSYAILEDWASDFSNDM